MRQLLVAIGITALLSVGVDGAQDTAGDPVFNFSDDDLEMNAAIAKARESLPMFWAKFKHPAANEDGFSLKVRISDHGQAEHFWCDNIRGSEVQATCVIANTPELVRTVTLGQRIDVDPATITDWMYCLNGKIVGGETIGVILRHLPEDQKAQYEYLEMAP